ncbi:hypothetical protein WICPIJ_003054 [Wickerhamomyces pijperi]|uniref:Uncharacterized protein n=1 Tax=Wickerhamomyces pijperi TaxID=599730 RepID=A0A9P8QAN5_WICPI|nr:hypothetical protein WICPIJ_003054 [Wickerhamomyces pijperi]
MSPNPIGLDFGSTHLTVAHHDPLNNRTTIIANPITQHSSTPSIITIADSQAHRSIVGEECFSLRSKYPMNTISDIKQLIQNHGRYQKGNVEMEQSDDRANPQSYNTKVEREKLMIEVFQDNEFHLMTPEEVLSQVLTQLKEIATDQLLSIRQYEQDQEVTHIAISVPSFFGNTARQAIKDAATIADMECPWVINDHLAASFTYWASKLRLGSLFKGSTILTIGIGAYGVDCSIVRVKSDKIRVIACHSDDSVGSEAITDGLVRHFAREFSTKNQGRDILSDEVAVRRLRSAVEDIKRGLCTDFQVRVTIDALYQGIDFVCSITVNKFELMFADLFNRMFSSVDKCIRQARIDRGQINEIILTGSTTKLTKVSDMIHSYFRGETSISTLDSEFIIAKGCSIAAQYISLAPSSHELSKELRNLCVQDITTCPIALISSSSPFDLVYKIPKGSKLPHTVTKTYITTKNNQSTIRVFVVEGKSNSDHKRLFQFRLSELPLHPAGELQLRITYTLDVSGVMSVAEITSNQDISQISHLMHYEDSRLTSLHISELKTDALLRQQTELLTKRRQTARESLDDLLFKIYRKTFKDVKVRQKVTVEELKILTRTCDEVFRFLEEEGKYKEQQMVQEGEYLRWRDVLEDVANPILARIC